DHIQTTAQSKLQSTPPTHHYPLLCLYNYLHETILSYRLEILRAQAHLLSTTRYNGAMHVDNTTPPSTLSIRFWYSDPKSRDFRLEIAIKFRPQTIKEENDSARAVAWAMTLGVPETAWIDVQFVERKADSEDTILPMEVFDEQLDIERLYVRAAEMMATKTLATLEALVGISRHSDAGLEVLGVEYGIDRVLQLAVDVRTGRIVVLDSEVGGREGKAVRELEEKVNDDVGSLIDSLKSLKFAVRIAC
ncbi:hypothetical protein HK096_000310, partial [Nowakowskiella sp. JEL0078]